MSASLLNSRASLSALDPERTFLFGPERIGQNKREKAAGKWYHYFIGSIVG
jgi:hypothetical protein